MTMKRRVIHDLKAFSVKRFLHLRIQKSDFDSFFLETSFILNLKFRSGFKSGIIIRVLIHATFRFNS